MPVEIVQAINAINSQRDNEPHTVSALDSGQDNQPLEVSVAERLIDESAPPAAKTSSGHISLQA